MNKKSLLGLFTVLIFTVAMHGTAYACTFDSDCLGDVSCNNGKCGDSFGGGCTFDSDCSGDARCSGGECTANSWGRDGCTFDSDCVGDARCGSSGQCTFEKWPN